MKACVKCEFFIEPGEMSEYTCSHEGNMLQITGWQEHQWVYGEDVPRTEPLYHCGFLRRSEEFCGPGAKWFKPKNE